MADSSVSFKDAAGATVQHDTRSATNGDLRPVVAIGTDGDNLAHVEAWGQLFVTQGPGTDFYDDFSGSSLNTSDLWTVSNGGAPTVAGGFLTPSATVSTYNAIRSQDVMPTGVGYCESRSGVRLEATAATGSGRFWGLGLPTGSPTAISLLTDGVGFEIDQATGALLAVTYSGGTRTTIATLTRPSDGLLHRYTVAHRVTATFWFIDGQQVSVANTTFANVTNADLPVCIVRQNAASFTGTPVFDLTATFAADTNRDSTSIADGLVGARRARVTDPSKFSGGQTTGSQGTALNVNPNAIQKATYIVSTTITSGALTANTNKALLSFEHAASAARTVRVRRIILGGFYVATTGLAAGTAQINVFRGTAASTAGTAFTPVPAHPVSAAAELAVKTLPTITAATSLLSSYIGSPANTALAAGTIWNSTLYDWQESGETIPLVLRAGALDSLVIGVQHTSTPSLAVSLTVILTEE